MKFFGKQSLSVYLFYTSKIIAIGIGLFMSFILFSLQRGNFDLNQNRFKIQVPILETYVEGDYSWSVILTIGLTLAYFVLFFYLLARIFKTFKAEILFSEKAIKHLNHFAILNLVCGPILYFLIHFIILHKTNFRDIHNLILSILLGIFALFVATVFKKGYRVQSENDLTI